MTPKLIFDARHLSRPYTGLGRYTGCLLNAWLTSSARQFEIDVLLHSSADWSNNPFHRALLQHQRVGLCSMNYIDAPPFSLRHHALVARYVNSRRPDWYFYPHFDLPLGLRSPAAFVVHDLLPLLVPGYVRRAAWLKQYYFRSILARALRTAAVCIAVSETTRKDILRECGEQHSGKISVVYEASTLVSDLADAARSPHPRPFLLYVGDRRPHKNLKLLIDVVRRLHVKKAYDGDLLLVGSQEDFGFDLESYTRDDPWLHVVGNTSDQDLAALYQHTDALMLLSQYEGFGLPVVEAARFERRVVVSHGGSLPEIAPPWACIVDVDHGVEACSESIGSYLASELKPIGADQYARKFTWERAAAEVSEALTDQATTHMVNAHAK